MALSTRLKTLLLSALGLPDIRDELVSQMVLQDGSNPAKGTTTNDNSAAGIVGEYASATQAAAANVPAASTHWGDIVSLSLAPGDWHVYGVVYFTLNGATCTLVQAGMSTTTGDSSTGLNAGDNLLAGPAPTSTVATSLSIPAFRLSLSATTTVYLKANCTYSAGNPQAQARLSARRVR